MDVSYEGNRIPRRGLSWETEKGYSNRRLSGKGGICQGKENPLEESFF